MYLAQWKSCQDNMCFGEQEINPMKNLGLAPSGVLGVQWPWLCSKLKDKLLHFYISYNKEHTIMSDRPLWVIVVTHQTPENSALTHLPVDIGGCQLLYRTQRRKSSGGCPGCGTSSPAFWPHVLMYPMRLGVSVIRKSTVGRAPLGAPVGESQSRPLRARNEAMPSKTEVADIP